jgi:hypothetical protein
MISAYFDAVNTETLYRVYSVDKDPTYSGADPTQFSSLNMYNLAVQIHHTDMA